MGCCSPNYRNSVNEEEEKINSKGAEKAPLLLKVLMTTIVCIGILSIILM